MHVVCNAIHSYATKAPICDKNNILSNNEYICTKVPEDENPINNEQ